MSDIYGRLAVPFAVSDHAKVSKGSGSQTYAPWTSYVQRLNDELQENWSFRAVREGFTETECWVLGEITATIDGVVTVRQQYGCEPIAVGQKPNGDLLKKAATDAIKKAASLLGVGLYLSDKEEREAIETAMREEARNGNRPAPKPPQTDAPAPTPINKGRAAAEMTGAQVSPERAELIESVQATMRKALARDLDFQQQDPNVLSDAQLREYGKALADMIRAAIAAKKAAS